MILSVRFTVAHSERNYTPIPNIPRPLTDSHTEPEHEYLGTFLWREATALVGGGGVEGGGGGTFI